VRQSQEDYERQMHAKQVANLKRRARQLGLEVTEKPAAPAQEGSAAGMGPSQGTVT
jgi:hypothetical protein